MDTNTNPTMYRPLERPPVPPQPQQPVPPSKKPLPPVLQKLLVHKTLVIFLIVVIVMGISTTTYILVAAAQDKQQMFSNAQALPPSPLPLPTDIPTPLPTVLPSPSIAIITPTPTTKPTPTPTISSTINWNTYANAQYGYTIKYPVNWTATNWGALEPLVPNYVVFNDNTATASARHISIGISTRSYADQMIIEGTTGKQVTLSGIPGTQQNFRDSDGNQSISVILRRQSDLLMLRSKTPYSAIFNIMLSTLKVTKK